MEGYTTFHALSASIDEGLQHGTCPACRYILFDIGQVTESDGESSDGDYIPGEDEDDEEEDDDFLDTDGFEDTEMAFGDLMDVEVPDEIQRSIHAAFSEWYADGDDEDSDMFEGSLDINSEETAGYEAAYWEMSDDGSEGLPAEEVAINMDDSIFDNG